MKSAPPVLEITPWLAAASALAAGFTHQMTAGALAAGLGATPAIYALAALLAYAVFFAMLAPRLGTLPARRLGFLRAPPGSALACLLLVASVLLISEVDNAIRHLLPLPQAVQDALAQEQAGAQAPAQIREAVELVLVWVAVLPLVHELFYRGLVQPVLVERLGAPRGVLLTAALEASAAFANPLFLWDWPVVATRGVVLGTLRQCTGSLWPSLALHALMGAAQAAAHYELFGIPGFDVRDTAHTPATWLAAAALPTALGLWRCRSLSRTPVA